MLKIQSNNLKKDIFILIIGLLSYYKIRMIGTFALAEIITICSFPILFIGQWGKSPELRKFFIWSCIWLMGVFLADTFNNTSTENMLKGNLNVVFLILSIPFVYWMFYDCPKRIIWFWIGNGLSCLYNYYFQREDILYDAMAAEVWGIYAYRTIITVIATVLYFYDKKKIAYIILLGYGFYSLFHFSRNIILVNTLAVIFMIYVDKFKDKNYKSSVRKLKNNMSVLIISLLLGGAMVTYIYSSLAEKGTLGENVQNKYFDQKESKEGLMSGRSEWFDGSYMALKNPILGYGSYAVDKNNMSGEYALFYGNGDGGRGLNELLPGHSYILGAWLFSGILGFLYFFYILKILFSYLYKYTAYDDSLLCINVCMIGIMVWNVLFSPFADRLLLLSTCIPLLILKEIYDKRYGIK